MIISDLILGWLHEDGYSLGECELISLLPRRRWIQVEEAAGWGIKQRWSSRH